MKHRKKESKKKRTELISSLKRLKKKSFSLIETIKHKLKVRFCNHFFYCFGVNVILKMFFSCTFFLVNIFLKKSQG